MTSVTLLDAFREHVNEHPDRLFALSLQDGASETLTFRRLYERASCYANLFHRYGLRRGDIIIIILLHGSDLYAAFLGALLCECIPSFMPFPSEKQDPVRYWESHRELFQRIGLGAVLTYPDNAEELLKHIPTSGLSVIVAGEAVGLPENHPFPYPNREDIAFLQHSSGTTGLKKGVQISYGALADQVASYAAALQLTGEDKIATWLPLYHDMGLIACFMLPLTLGMSIVSMDAFEWAKQPEMLLQAIETYHCTYVWLPNFAFHHLCLTAASRTFCDLSGVKAFINCSEPCKPDTFDLFIETFAHVGVRREQLQTCYAMAETVFAITQSPLDHAPTVVSLDRRALIEEGRAVSSLANQPATRLLSVGQPVSGIDICIIGAAGQRLPEGCVGEVAVSGRFLFSGYFRNDKATRDSFQGDWYRTGDTGLFFEGELYILGRIKELIIIYGKNLYCHDIEAICNELEGVKKGRCVALGVYNEILGSEELVIIAEAEDDHRDKYEEVRKAVKSALVKGISISPRDIKIVEAGWLVKSTAGKIARGENLMKYLRCLGDVGTELTNKVSPR